MLKTAKNEIVEKCFQDNNNKSNKMVCLIQSSIIDEFRKRYKEVDFIDIKRESFYDLPEQINEYLMHQEFDKLLIPLSGKTVHNFGNVMDVVRTIRFREGYFFYSDGKTIRIPNYGVVLDSLISVLISVLYKLS